VSDKSTEENNVEENFEDLLESYSSGLGEDIRVGDKVRGEIIAFSKDSVFIDTGAKIDGVVDRAELLDENQEMPYKEGDTLELYVVSRTGNEIRLSKALSGIGGLSAISEAFRREVPIEGKIKGQVKGGFHVDVMKRRGFCPISQIDITYVEHPEEYVGQTFNFLITQFEDRGKNIVLSRRKILEAEREESRRHFMKEIETGRVYEGKVTKLMPYGAFIELFPGIEGMVHLSEMGWGRTDKPGDVLKTGETVTVKIIHVEPGKKPGQVKISLSMKQITEDPWNTLRERFRISDKIVGRVTRCAKFGAFVELEPGIEGLVHISEMSYNRRLSSVEEMVQPGDTVEVQIKDIDLDNRRIALSMKDAAGDPWVAAREKYQVGSSIEGTVEKKEKFGIFVNLEPGVTGLIPKSKLEQATGLEKAKEGDRIRVIIEEMHPEDRKMTLAPHNSKNEDEWKRFAADTGKSIGSLGEKLRQAIRTKAD
jgi:small subunit ribosomal protein S1